MIARILLTLLCLLTLATSASAWFYDGNTLVKLLREWERAERSDPQTNFYAAAQYSG